MHSLWIEHLPACCIEQRPQVTPLHDAYCTAQCHGSYGDARAQLPCGQRNRPTQHVIGYTNENHNEIPEKSNQVQGLLDPLRVRWLRGFAARPHNGQQRGEV